MIRNIPVTYMKDAVLEEIDIFFKGRYDFFNLPYDNKVYYIIENLHISKIQVMLSSIYWTNIQSESFISILREKSGIECQILKLSNLF